MKNGNMPAMPTYELNGQNVLEDTSYGMTKREQFAMAAMQGLLANPDEQTVGMSVTKMIKFAVMNADELLAALEQDSE